MRLETLLRPFMHELYEENSSIGNNAAVEKIQRFVRRQSNASIYDRMAMHVGYLTCWRELVRRRNAQARNQLKRTSIGGTIIPFPDSPFSNLQLPLPDGQSKITMGKSRAADLRQSAALMIGQARGMYATIRQTLAAAELLEQAGDEVGNPDLLLEEALDLGLINIKQLAA